MPIFDFDLFLPRNWTLVLLAAAVVGAFCCFWWRRHWLHMACGISVMAGVMILLLLVSSWSTRRLCGLVWSPGAQGGFSIGFVSMHGEMSIQFKSETEGAPAPFSGRLQLIHFPKNTETQSLFVNDDFTIYRSPRPLEKVGIQFAHRHRDSENRYAIALPHWLVILLFCPWFPLIWFHKRRRRRHRTRHNLCTACGFDLRGLPPDSAACSECGTPVNRTPAPAQPALQNSPAPPA